MLRPPRRPRIVTAQREGHGLSEAFSFINNEFWVTFPRVAMTKIQLAVQGGGAKVCVLMAALQAVQELENDGKLHVTGLAGTSAGSIAASLYAAGHDLGDLRRRALENRETLRKIIPRMSSRLSVAWNMARRRPLWTQDDLRTLLDTLLHEQKVHSFSDLAKITSKRLVVIGTDLTDGRSTFYSHPTQSIVNAVLDSCAIPFFFRGPLVNGDGVLVVDGGICENLPVDALEQDEKNEGMIVGITFRPRGAGRAPGDWLRFSKSLLDAAMDNSVRRAQRRLGSERLFEIDTDIDTLAFDRALDIGFGDHYDEVYEAAMKFFGALAKDRDQTLTRPIPEEGWDTDSATTLQKHADIYAAQHRNEKVAYDEAHVIVQVEALTAFVRGASGLEFPDRITYQLQFAPDQVPVFCHRVAVIDENDKTFLQSFRREVRDRTGEVVPTIDLKARDSRTGERGYLLFFETALRPGDPAAPYELRYTHQIGDMMRPLATKGDDVFGLRLSRASGPTRRILLVAMIPDAFRVTIGPAEHNATSNPGRILTDAEMFRERIPVPAGYYALGWLGENVAAGERFGARLRWLDAPRSA